MNNNRTQQWKKKVKSDAGVLHIMLWIMLGTLTYGMLSGIIFHTPGPPACPIENFEFWGFWTHFVPHLIFLPLGYFVALWTWIIRPRGDKDLDKLTKEYCILIAIGWPSALICATVVTTFKLVGWIITVPFRFADRKIEPFLSETSVDDKGAFKQ